MNLAIDIALLPPDDITQKAIEINQSLKSRKIDFGRELPHISLLMGVIEESELPKIREQMEKVVNKIGTLNLDIMGIHQGVNEIGETLLSFAIQKTPQLQMLHESLVKSIRPYLKPEINKHMLHESPNSEQRHLDYIQNFVQNSSFQNFDPHITLGVGKIEEADVQFSFQASRLAICHLGDYCTCRKILGECELTNDYLNEAI